VGTWLAAIAAAWLGAGPGAGDAPACTPELFRVVRNTNANVVVYEAHVEGGRLDVREPVRASWLMLAEDGRREELSLFERALAYGVEVHGEGAPGGAVVALRARPELEIQVSVGDGCPVARTRIAGREATLRALLVEASGGPLPQVRWVDLVGVDRESGREVRERLFPVEERTAPET
jgi:Domain of unknown function (DUF4833)